MQPVLLNNVPYLPKEINIVEEKQDWNNLISAIENNPDLLMTEEGESLLFLAALQFTENNDSEAGNFIEKAFSLCKEHKIPLNINSSPSKGPHQGKSVFWLLSYRYFKAICENFSKSYFFAPCQDYFSNESSSKDSGVGVSDLNFDDFRDGEENIFSQELLRSCLAFNCNVNATPKEGPFKDVTAYGHLVFDQELYFHPALYSQIICDSQIPQTANNMPKVTVIGSLVSIINQIENDTEIFTEEINYISKNKYSNEEIQQILDNCYHSLFKIIERNPNCGLDVVYEPSESSEDECASENSSESSSSDDYHSFVEVIFSMPSSPNRDKLLLYYIFAGAKIPDTAKQEWKDNYNEILKKQKFCF